MNWLKKLLSNKHSDPLAVKLSPILGFEPIAIDLYYQAFCHSSIDTSEYGNNERLEFLGDSILDAVITEYLYHTLPGKNEGILTDMRSKMVSRRTLNKLGKEFNLSEFIQSNLGGSTPSSVIGNAFEALIAAIYLDKGSEFCKTFIIQNIIEKYFDLNELEKQISSYKKHFIHWSQKNNRNYKFELISESGESHNKSFEIALKLDNILVTKSTSSSKKKAEESAAKKACKKLSL